MFILGPIAQHINVKEKVNTDIYLKHEFTQTEISY